jgi:hypothetical protein
MAKSSIRSVIALHRNEAGEIVPVTLFEAPEKKGKTDRMLRPLRRMQRQMAEAQLAMAQEYLDRFDRSDAKKKNGWMVDDAENRWKAMRKAAKKLKLTKMM